MLVGPYNIAPFKDASLRISAVKPKGEEPGEGVVTIRSKLKGTIVEAPKLFKMRLSNGNSIKGNVEVDLVSEVNDTVTFKKL